MIDESDEGRHSRRARDRLRSVSAWQLVLTIGFGLFVMGLVIADLRPVIAVTTGAAVLVVGQRFVSRNRGIVTKPITWILACGPLGLVAGITAAVQEGLTGRPAPFPGPAEAIFVICYVGLIIGIDRLRRVRTTQRDPEGLVDGAIVALAISLVTWITVVAPGVRESETVLAAVTKVGFTVLITTIIAVTARLAIGPGARAASWYLLGGAIVAFVTADLAAPIAPEVPSAASPLIYTLFVAALLHPSMPRLFERDTRPRTTVGLKRFLLLATALLVAPVTLIVLAIDGDRDDIVVTAVGAAGLAALVLARLSLMLRTGAEQARLEHLLRQASDRLLLAADRDALQQAAIDAVILITQPLGEPSITLVDEAGARDPEDDRVTTVPFAHPDHPDAGIEVTAPRPISTRIQRALDTLGTNLALALETAELTEALARSRVERRFQALVENSSDLIIVVGLDRVISFVSPASRRLLGHDEATLVGAPASELPVVEDVALLDDLLTQSDGTTFSLPVEVRLLHVDGSHRWFEVAARDLTSEPEVEGYVLNCREVTDRKDAELRLFRSEARFRALVQNVGDVVAVIDDWGRFTYVSPAITPLLGYRAEQLLDTPATAIIATDQRREAQDLLLHALRGSADRATGASIELRALALDGTVRTLDVTVSDLRHDPAVHGIVLNARDVTVRKQLESSLRHQAHHDALTGLANRTRFGELVEHTAAEGNGAACVLFVDLDDFKTVNDSLGHAVGDELLMAVAGRLTSSLPSGATAARLGGDEFAVLVGPSDDDLGPVGVALRLLHELRVPFDVNGWEIVVTASIGIAAIGDEGTTAEVVLRNADMAMYLAKERGKDRVELFEEAMHVTAFERLELKADLARAITSGQLALVYQPVVALETGRITGAEALVRWDHPRRGRLPPDAFIGIAEETGLIVQLGQWVLEEACQQLRTWQLTLPTDAALSMSVNLSVRQLEQPSIVESVRQVVDQFALDPKTLTLEITETVVIDHMEDDRSRLTALKALGVQIALDDFGIGYSSLRYADDLPVDVLKVDRSFVAGITDSEATPVLEAIVALGGRLGVHTVAEGIENPKQIAALKAIGCDLGQGYWFSPPIAPEAFAELLTRNLASGGFDTSGAEGPTGSQRSDG